MATNSNARRHEDNSTVRTFVQRAATGELRATFESTSDAEGYSLHELDALTVAIQIARRQLAEEEETELHLFVADETDLQNRFDEQQSRLAAPT